MQLSFPSSWHARGEFNQLAQVVAAADLHGGREIAAGLRDESSGKTAVSFASKGMENRFLPMASTTSKFERCATAIVRSHATVSAAPAGEGRPVKVTGSIRY